MKRHLVLAQALHKEPFFKALSPEVVGRIRNYVFHREYEPRQVIYFPEEPCEHVYWVRYGRVEVRRCEKGRRNLTLRHLFPGDLFGEDCLVKDDQRGTCAVASVPTAVCLMWAEDFRRVVADEGEVALALALQSARRVVDLENVFAETVFKAVRSRVAGGLLRLYHRVPLNEKGALRVTHQEIASLVGSTRETITAVLHELREDGIVTTANRRVTVLDPVALEHTARSG